MGNHGSALDLLNVTQIPKLHMLTQQAGHFLFFQLLGRTRMVRLQLQDHIGRLIINVHTCNGASGNHHSEA
ncbi:hypothetical protein D3C81_777520 [compost metagenome]